MQISKQTREQTYFDVETSPPPPPPLHQLYFTYCFSLGLQSTRGCEWLPRLLKKGEKKSKKRCLLRCLPSRLPAGCLYRACPVNYPAIHLQCLLGSPFCCTHTYLSPSWLLFFRAFTARKALETGDGWGGTWREGEGADHLFFFSGQTLRSQYRKPQAAEGPEEPFLQSSFRHPKLLGEWLVMRCSSTETTAGSSKQFSGLARPVILSSRRIRRRVEASSSDNTGTRLLPLFDPQGRGMGRGRGGEGGGSG